MGYSYPVFNKAKLADGGKLISTYLIKLKLPSIIINLAVIPPPFYTKVSNTPNPLLTYLEIDEVVAVIFITLVSLAVKV